MNRNISFVIGRVSALSIAVVTIVLAISFIYTPFCISTYFLQLTTVALNPLNLSGKVLEAINFKPGSPTFVLDMLGYCFLCLSAFAAGFALTEANEIDYTHEDFTQNGQVYDVIFDTFGKAAVSRTRRSLKQKGHYLLATFGLPTFIQLLWFSKTSNQDFEYRALEENTEDLIFLKDLIESGVVTPIIDRCYPLEQAAEAHRYVETGRKVGNVVLTVYQDNRS